MYKFIFGVLLSLALLGCGVPSEETSGHIPGAGDKKLTTFQTREIQGVMGALGDINFIEKSLATKTPTLLNNSLVNRDVQRRALRASMKLNRCSDRYSGNYWGASFSMFYTGKRCGVDMSLQQTREVRQNGPRKSRETVELEQSFSAKRTGVNTDIMFVDGEGMYSYQKTRDNGDVRRVQMMTYDLKGRSRSGGNFTYSLDETFDRQFSADTGSWSDNYERKDIFEVGTSYKVTLFKLISAVDGIPGRASFYLNGDAISEREYNELIQDMDRQLGIEPFANQAGYPAPSSL